jgi:hypothetical protein
MICNTGVTTAAMASPSAVDDVEGKVDDNDDGGLSPKRGEKHP